MLNTKMATSAENIVVVHPYLNVDDVYAELLAAKLPVVKETTGVHKKLLEGRVPEKAFKDKLLEKAFAYQFKIFLTDYPYKDTESNTLVLMPESSVLSKYEDDLAKGNREIKEFLASYHGEETNMLYDTSSLIEKLQSVFGEEATEEKAAKQALDDKKKNLKSAGVEEAGKIMKNKTLDVAKKVFKKVTSAGVEEGEGRQLRTQAKEQLTDQNEPIEGAD